MKLVTAKEMQEIDSLAQKEYAVPGIVLMDQAAKAAASVIIGEIEVSDGDKAVIFCGSGNNGGDGFGVARWLRSYDVNVEVIFFGGELENLSGDAKTEMQMFVADGGRIAVVKTDDDWLIAEISANKADILVDALLGTGFHGGLSEVYRRACVLLNSCKKKVVSIDLPTGVNADDGSVDEDAVKASLTITMALEKPALWLYPACLYCGDVYKASIGMPAKLLAEYPSKKYRLNNSIIKELLPVLAENAHKGDAGRVVVCAGSPGYTGAAALCSYAVVKAGAGLVALMTPLSSREVLAVKLDEVMVNGLIERMPGVLGGGAVSDVVKRAAEADVLAIGPGLGISDSTQQAVRDMLEKVTVPVVIDADALTALQGHLEVLNKMQSPKVLTPHAGEMARLIGLDAEEIDRRRVELAGKYAKEWNAVVVLKGAPTAIGCPDGTVYLNTTGTKALATGGSGDVLTGIIAGLAAQKISVQEAALCGVYLHGLAATISKQGVDLAAGEIVNYLAEARNIIANDNTCDIYKTGVEVIKLDGVAK